MVVSHRLVYENFFLIRLGALKNTPRTLLGLVTPPPLSIIALRTQVHSPLDVGERRSFIHSL